MEKVKLTVIDPIEGTEIPIEAESDATAKAVISEFMRKGVIPYGNSYSLNIEKSDGTILACGETKTLEDYDISDGDILKIVFNDKADHAQKQDDPLPAADTLESKIEILSRNGIDFDQLPPVDLKKWLENLKGSPLFDSIIMLLHDYKAALEENKQRSILREKEYETLRQSKIKLEVQVKEYDRKSGEKKSAAILLAVANVVVALGTAFLSTNVIPSVAVIAAGVIMIGIGLWLSFKQ